jgi:aminopeptidase-like protein
VTAAGEAAAAARIDGEAVLALLERLLPIPRSLTGDGVRETLAVLAEHVPGLEVHEVPTGTQALDWTVPREWNVREAWLAAPDGARVADWRASPLHLVGYSIPVRARMGLEELQPHLHSLPERPDDIPYRTAYWADDWGFCLRHRDRERLADGEYEVLIDSTLEPGSLTYGEAFLPGSEESELLLSAHVCHPAMANDNASGLAVAATLAARLADRPRRHGIRFLFTPGTIGSIVWLSRNEPRLQRLRAGLVLACLGDAGGLTYKRSRRGDAAVDAAVECVLRDRGGSSEVRPFVPYGYDERQFCSPGFDLPVGRLTRTPNGEYPEYHTSADDRSVVSADALADSVAALEQVVDVLQRDRTYVNLSPKGEPQLGRRGLYGPIGGVEREGGYELALLWVLSLSDGSASLLDVASRAGLPFAAVAAAAAALHGAGLLAEAA